MKKTKGISSDFMELSEFTRKDKDYDDNYFKYCKEKDYDKAIEVIKEHIRFLKKEKGIVPKALEERLDNVSYLKYLQDIKNNYAQGYELAKKGKIDDAIKVYEKNLELNCHITHSYFSLSRLYHSIFDFENEKRVYELAIQNVDGDISIYESSLENVEQFLNTGKWKWDCLPSDPKPLGDDIKEAKAILKNDKEKGIGMLEDIMVNGTFNNTVYYTLYMTYKKDKRYDDAIRVCEKAIEVLGFFSNERKEIWEDNLERVSRYNPFEEDIKEAKNLIQIENKDDGIAVLEDIMANGTFNNTVDYTLHMTYKKDKGYEDSIRVCEKAIAYYIDLKFDKALSELNRVLKIDSNNLDAILLKGEILTGLHKYDEAIKTFNKLPSESLPTGYKRLIEYINEFGENNAGFFGTFKFESHWEYVYVESDIFKRLKSDYLDELEIEVLKRGLIWKGVNRSLQMKSTTQNKINHALSTELLYDFDDRGYDNMVPISEKSINIFNNIIKSDPDNIIALNNKGYILLKLDRLDEALICFRQALAIDSNDYHIWFNKAFVYLNGGEYYHAKDCFDKYFELNNVPNEDLAFHLQEVGWELYESDRYSESIKCYDLCIKFNPNVSNFWNCKAISQTALGQFDDALLNYDKALEIEPDDEIIIGNKISCLKQYIDYQKDYLKPIECFKELLSLEDYIGYELESKLRDLIEFYIDLGVFHFENQNYLSAIKCFNLILPIVLDEGILENILLYKYKCFIEIILDEPNESSMICQLYLINCLKELVEINPNNIIYFEDLIYNLMSINEFDEAIEYCEKGIEIHPYLENLKKLCLQHQNEA